MKLSLDSNVLIYAADDSEGQKQDIAVSLIRGGRAFNLFLTGQTLGEM